MSQPCSVLAVGQEWPLKKDLSSLVLLTSNRKVTHEQMGTTPNILVKVGLRFRKNEFNRKFLYMTSDEWLSVSEKHNFWK